jgi:hypothetical protein
LNKHPNIFINYLRVLAGLKGIKFQIQSVPEEQRGQPKKKKTKKNAKIEQILTARDLTYEEFEELRLKKRAGKTTTQENLQVDKWYWQDFFETTELKEEILQNFVYDQNPFKNFLALIDVANHHAEDNLKSDKQLERVKVAERLLQLLGWEHARDENQLKKELVKDNFAEKVVKDPLFKKQKRLNELFDLEKAYNIHAEMTPQQILMWANSLLKPFSLQIKAGEKVYRLELQNDLMSLIARKNKRGREYKDSRNLLNQQVKRRVAEEDDQFLDDEVAPAATPTGEAPAAHQPATGKPKTKKAKKRINTALLDVGINHDLD